MKTILLAEDDLALSDVLSQFLEDSGYHVLCVTDGDEAMRALERSGADLVLCDVVMPGLSGLDVCQRISEHPVYRDVPVVLMTAVPERLPEDSCRYAALIRKPFDLELLLITLAEFTDDSRS